MLWIDQDISSEEVQGKHSYRGDGDASQPSPVALENIDRMNFLILFSFFEFSSSPNGEVAPAGRRWGFCGSSQN